VASLVVWCVGLALATIPLLPVTSHWQFYSQTAICIPLPITRNDFPGQTYSFSIVIVLNFVLFLCVSVGQVVIYWSVQANSMSTFATTSDTATSKTLRKDVTIARRLITVAMSNFLCCFLLAFWGC
jgi:leucine-rich repeat-containing G protein-coupled receptor 7/leucine-rich repeat-containing G protein-coupled receptor 8